MDQAATLEFLEHYGVRGMHWGIRNDKPARKVSSDYKKTAAYRKRHPQELSNKQLKSINERLNLETNYKRMNPSKIAAGHETVKRVLGVVGTVSTAYAFVKSPLGQALVKNGSKFIKAGKILKTVA
jgi:hypothetical protein